jgi:hypothetical protein
MKTIHTGFFFLIACVLSALTFAETVDIATIKADFTGKNFSYREVLDSSNYKGIGKQQHITRRDPSDIIKIGDTYFLYYTRVDQNELPQNLKHLKASGYVGTIWYATSKNEGLHWAEHGPAFEKGKPGTFDTFAVFNSITDIGSTTPV